MNEDEVLCNGSLNLSTLFNAAGIASNILLDHVLMFNIYIVVNQEEQSQIVIFLMLNI